MESPRLFKCYDSVEALPRIDSLDDMCDILWPYEVSDGIEDRQPDFGGVLLYGEGRCLARREAWFG
jgi:hypothetical protein